MPDILLLSRPLPTPPDLNVAKSDVKTKANAASVTAFLNGVADGQKRKDCLDVPTMMKQVTKEEPTMGGRASVASGACTPRASAAAKANGC